MRDYARVSPKFWVGTTGRAIRLSGADAQIVAMYLMTSPHSNVIGLYYLPLVYLSHETGIPLGRCSNAVRTLSEHGFCAYDEASEVIWIYEMARWQLGDSGPQTNHAKGAASVYAEQPENAFLGAFYEKYKDRLPLSERRSSAVPTPSEHRSNNGATERRSDGATATEQQATGVADAVPTASGALVVAGRSLPPDKPSHTPPHHADIATAYAHWRLSHERAAPSIKTNSDGFKKAAARLKEGRTLEDLIAAIDGMHATPWYVENNQTAFEMAMRPDKFLMFLENNTAPPQTLTAKDRAMRNAYQRAVSGAPGMFDGVLDAG